MKRLIIGLAVLLWGGRADAAIEIMIGPNTLPIPSTGGWSNSGLQITALQDVTLNSFVFRNQGEGDTIRLTHSGGTELRTLNVVGGNDDLSVDVDWQLDAGIIYRLISELAGNNRYSPVTVPGFPFENSHLRVDGSIYGPGNGGSGSLQTGWWFTFTNLQTDDDPHAVPEPSTLAIWGLLGLCAIGRGWRRRRSIAD